jgi:hypothetical protein
MTKLLAATVALTYTSHPHPLTVVAEDEQDLI